MNSFRKSENSCRSRASSQPMDSQKSGKKETKKALSPYELETGHEMGCLGAAGESAAGFVCGAMGSPSMPGWQLCAALVKEKSLLLRSSYRLRHRVFPRAAEKCCAARVNGAM